MDVVDPPSTTVATPSSRKERSRSIKSSSKRSSRSSTGGDDDRRDRKRESSSKRSSRSSTGGDDDRSKRSRSSKKTSSSSHSRSSSHRKRERRDGDDATTARSVASGRSRSSSRRTKIKHDDDDVGSVRFRSDEKVTVLPLPISSFVKSYDAGTAPSGSDTTIRVDPVSSTDNPIVVSFPSGLPHATLRAEQQKQKRQRSGTARSVSFREDTSTNDPAPTFTWSKARTSSTSGRALHGHDRTSTYTASNRGLAFDGRLTKLTIALYHRPSNTLRIVPVAERGTVFSLAQDVHGAADDTGGGTVDGTTLSYDERRRLLFDSFGSTKKRRALRSRAANVVEMRSVVGAGDGMMDALGKQGGAVSRSNLEAMEEVREGDGGGVGGGGVLSKSMTTTAVQKAEDAARRTYLPPYDPTADAPHKVYDSAELAGEDAWGQISRRLDHALHTADGPQPDPDPSDSPFGDPAPPPLSGDDVWIEALTHGTHWFASTRALLSSIKSPASRQGARYQIKTVVLVNQLLLFHTQFCKKFVPDVRDADGDTPTIAMAKQVGIPLESCAAFLTLYTTPTIDRGATGYAVTKQLKDKRVLHILVMYVLAHGMGMKVAGIEGICEDLRVGVTDAQKLCRMAGFWVKRGRLGWV